MWIIDSGDYRHMKSDHVSLTSIREKRISIKVEIGDNNSYAVKGIGKASIELESGNNINLCNVLYVPGLK
jgi:hypothetical protein